MSELPFWTKKHERDDQDDDGRRDPLRAQVVLDALADALFKSPNGPGLTSLTDHLGYLALHVWAKYFSEVFTGAAAKSAYHRLIWQHAYLNWEGYKKDRKISRFVVYGVNTLKKLVPKYKILSIPRWQDSPGKIVMLDPAARYENLCKALPAKVVEKCKIQYADRASLKKLKYIAKGHAAGIDLRDKYLFKVFDLNKLTKLRPIAQYLSKSQLSSAGLANGLQQLKLWDTLKSVSSRQDALSPDDWTDKFINMPYNSGGVAQLLHRAALGRALVFSANWAFYEWAYGELGVTVEKRSKLIKKYGTPVKLLKKVKDLLGKSAKDKEALHQIDNICSQSGTPFKLREVLNCDTPKILTDYVIKCAKESEKGFVDHNGKPNKDLIERFSGSYAGAMRLPQAWRFGKDMDGAL